MGARSFPLLIMLFAMCMIIVTMSNPVLFKADTDAVNILPFPYLKTRRVYSNADSGYKLPITPCPDRVE
jgi:lipopolysaccharide/colanic/teichoic acid biosynthesis glycosyltransferase